MFFTKRQKEMALTKGYLLEREYELSERDLIKVAKTGNEKQLEKAMSVHHDIEYALLYTYTPEYKQLIIDSFRRK